MHALHVLDFSPPYGGGMVRHLSALGREMRSGGDRVTFAFPRRRPWFDDLTDAGKLLVVPQIRCPLRSGFRGRCAAICRDEKVDLVHLHFSFALPFALSFSLTRWSPPVVYQWHNPPKALQVVEDASVSAGLSNAQSRGASGAWATAIARWVDRRVIAHHVAISREITSLLVHHGWARAEKIATLPNSVEMPAGTRRSGRAAEESSGHAGRAERTLRGKRPGGGPARLPAPGDGRAGLDGMAAGPVMTEDPEPVRLEEPVIGCVANFRPQKDHATLIEAFALVLRHHPGARLILVGDGPLRGQWEAMAARLGVSERIEFAGYVLDTSAAYRRFDLLVLSTHFEGQGLVLLEGMAHGLPVVATDLQSIRETMTDGVHGLLVAPRDPASMAGAILRLLDDPALGRAFGRAGRDRMVRDFSLPAWVAGIRRVYAQVLERS